MRDPYSLLGVKRDAGADEIKAAWRSKAKTLHPDHNQDDPSATKKFAEVGQAYEVLKDPDRRRRYDKALDTKQTIMQQREAARQAEERAKAARANAERVMEELARANAQRAQNQAKAKAGPAAEGAEDMVERIFGADEQAKQQQKQAHHQQQQQQQAQAQPESAAPRPEETPAGDAAAPKSQPLPLQAIELLTNLMRRIRGTAPPPEKAPDLLTTATVTLTELLEHSWVSAQLPDEREVSFALEAGMTDGHVVRLKGQGIKLPNAQRGDVQVTLKIARDPRFRVEGYDLHTVLPISLEDAVLGGEAEVETLTGKTTVSVPAWSGSDQSIRLEGQGLPNDAGGRGDIVVELRVVLWEKPNQKVVDLMRHMRHGLFL
ncbi:DnaJ C-terminal domain-containing protein [Rhizobium oryzicola]|uniref:DnaJ C-terminal domain-containing protein n=1 Tax=Rhizobium oryzicola TaxID=1232668 RepID=A0ABT8STR1_9HYPH|nr:DnaJ C-terminal domain-containing protein [Rhizobium oryzicola]MDO1581288.1 DnaJ C-terminal domain-containing protein [Rhizobium oryzicola]